MEVVKKFSQKEERGKAREMERDKKTKCPKEKIKCKSFD